MEKKQNKKTILLVIAGLVFMAGLGVVFDKYVTNSESNPKEEVKVKDYEMETIDGEKVKMSDYEGKKLMLFFYETNCPYCIQGIPEVEALDLEALDMNVLMINMTFIEKSLDDVKEKQETLNMKQTIILDREGELSGDFRISGTPTHMFIDEDGTVLGGVPGLLSTEAIVEIVNNFEE